MVEKALVEYSYGIDEEIIKEDNGFVHKIVSNDGDVVSKIEKASKSLEKELGKGDLSDLETADEKLKPLIELFAKHKSKIKYSYDSFENGVIRVFETEDESLVPQLHEASDSLATTEDERSKAEVAYAEKLTKEEDEEIEEWNPEKEREALEDNLAEDTEE